jgi:hypothetical protein
MEAMDRLTMGGDGPKRASALAMPAEPVDRRQLSAMAARLDKLIEFAVDYGTYDTDAFVTMRLADLRQMDCWGVEIIGESVGYYFDLGSIDDIVPAYPVTVKELLLLRAALDKLSRRQGAEADHGIRRSCPEFA